MYFLIYIFLFPIYFVFSTIPSAAPKEYTHNLHASIRRSYRQLHWTPTARHQSVSSPAVGERKTRGSNIRIFPVLLHIQHDAASVRMTSIYASHLVKRLVGRMPKSGFYLFPVRDGKKTFQPTICFKTFKSSSENIYGSLQGLPMLWAINLEAESEHNTTTIMSDCK